MKTLRTVTLAAFATVVLATATAPAGTSAIGGCGPVGLIQDPGLRASFARFDETQSVGAAKICAIYRNGVAR